MGSGRAAPASLSLFWLPRGFPPGPAPPAHCTPASHNPLPPPQVTMLAGRAAAVEGLSAPSLHRPPRRCAGCLSVYSCLSAAAGLSRVLGRRSAPGSGSNCGPGVRQPSSRGRGPDRGALERGHGTRRAEGRPLPAEAEACVTTKASSLLETPDAAADLPLCCGNLRRRTERAQCRRRRLRPRRRSTAGRLLPSRRRAGVGLLCAEA